jgi:hypothetical protein
MYRNFFKYLHGQGRRKNRKKPQAPSLKPQAFACDFKLAACGLQLGA